MAEYRSPQWHPEGEMKQRALLAYEWVHTAAKKNIVKHYFTDIAHDAVFITTTKFPYYLAAMYKSGSHIEGCVTKPERGNWEVERVYSEPLTWFVLTVEEGKIEEL